MEVDPDEGLTFIASLSKTKKNIDAKVEDMFSSTLKKLEKTHQTKDYEFPVTGEKS